MLYAYLDCEQRHEDQVDVTEDLDLLGIGSGVRIGVGLGSGLGLGLGLGLGSGSGSGSGLGLGLGLGSTWLGSRCSVLWPALAMALLTVAILTTWLASSRCSGSSLSLRQT